MARARVQGILSLALKAAMAQVSATADERKQAEQMLQSLAEFAAERGLDRPTKATTRSTMSTGWLDQKWAELHEHLPRIKQIVEATGRIVPDDTTFVRTVLAIVATELMSREHSRLAAAIEQMQLTEQDFGGLEQ